MAKLSDAERWSVIPLRYVQESDLMWMKKEVRRFAREGQARRRWNGFGGYSCRRAKADQFADRAADAEAVTRCSHLPGAVLRRRPPGRQRFASGESGRANEGRMLAFGSGSRALTAALFMIGAGKGDIGGGAAVRDRGFSVVPAGHRASTQGLPWNWSAVCMVAPARHWWGGWVVGNRTADQ